MGDGRPGGGPARHERTFRVRHYECDAYGHLNNTAYLRYLEEVELDAGLVDGEGWRWHSAKVTYAQPVGFGDELRVRAETTAVEPLRRRYDFATAAGARAAVAEVRWLDAAADGPAPAVPPESGAARPFRQHREVEWRDVDATLAVSPATMAEYAEGCGLALLAAFGWPLERCTAAGFAMVLRTHDVTYGVLPRLGDEMTVTTWESDRSRVSAVRHYLFTGAGGDVLARFASRYVWLDAATRRPIRIPADFLGDFAGNFADA